MARSHRRLTARTIDSLSKPGRYGDGDGLWLQITDSGSKSFLLRFMLNGKAREMGLGPASLISLAEARQTAHDARRLLMQKIDPIEARRNVRIQARLEVSKGKPFKDCAVEYIEGHEASWKNPKHRAQWKSTLETFAYPVIGHLAVGEIDTEFMLRILKPIWAIKTDTAKRLRGRIESVLDWATAKEFRQGPNPARWRGHLDKLLASPAKLRPVRHHPALPYKDMPQFMMDLRRRDCISALALEFSILAASRTSELIDALWSEIDLVDRVWTIPAERMKAKREHRVPLTERAVEILNSLPREDGNDHLFIGDSAGGGLSDAAMLELLRGMRPGFVVHGFRATFKTWAGEETNYAREVVEAALAHSLKDKTEAAYERGDKFEKRRALMGDWAKYCGMGRMIRPPSADAAEAEEAA